MGSITFEGVRFAYFTDDHDPPHVHGFYAGIEVIVEVSPQYADLARRKRNIIPKNAKRADVAHVLNVAAANRAKLYALRGQNVPSSER